MAGTLLTTIGAAKVTNALAFGTQVVLTEMAVGDGNGAPVVPSPGATALARERYRAPINDLRVDPNNSQQIIAELVIPPGVGGWVVREVGVFDSTGAMFAYGSLSDRYKPLLSEGETVEFGVRMILKVQDTSVVTLQIDPALVAATRKWTQDNFLSRLGGTTGQVLRKKSNIDNDVEWFTPPTPGNVFGPASATAGAIPQMDATGKILSDSKLRVDADGNIWGHGSKPEVFSGTSLTLDATYAGKVIWCTSANPVTITLPNNLPAGFSVLVIQGGDGQVTFTSSNPIISADDLKKSAKKGAPVSVFRPVSGTWWLGGQLAA